MKNSLAIVMAVKKKNMKPGKPMVQPKDADSAAMSEGSKNDQRPVHKTQPSNSDMSMMDPKSLVGMIMAKKLKANEFNDSQKYQESVEADALNDNVDLMEDGEGEMPYGDDDDFKSGNEILEDDGHDKIPGDAEHEIEGMGSSRQAMARKGMLQKIMGNLAAKHAGR